MSLVQPTIAPALPVWTRVRRIVIIGSSDIERVRRRASSDLSTRIEIVRVISPQESPRVLSMAALRADRIWAIVLANDDKELVRMEWLLAWRLTGTRVFDEDSFWEVALGRVHVDAPDTQWLLSGLGSRHTRMRQVGTRVFDMILAAGLAVLTFPLMLVVAGLIKIDSPGPIMYRQERVGLRGRAFILYKFRSMRQDAEGSGTPQWASESDPRITRVGRLIRYTRIDELPQLANVIRGDMSIIGPRPERPYFVDKLSEAIPVYSLRHFVKPGITGWAQVNASYGASVEDSRVKLMYDLYYIKHRGLLLDLSILLRTLKVVLFQQGAR